MVSWNLDKVGCIETCEPLSGMMVIQGFLQQYEETICVLFILINLMTRLGIEGRNLRMVAASFTSARTSPSSTTSSIGSSSNVESSSPSCKSSLSASSVAPGWAAVYAAAKFRFFQHGTTYEKRWIIEDLPRACNVLPKQVPWSIPWLLKSTRAAARWSSCWFVTSIWPSASLRLDCRHGSLTARICLDSEIDVQSPLGTPKRQMSEG